jgi:hypothetical protein
MAAARLLGIDERDGLERLGWHEVVVHDDDINPGGARPAHPLVVGRAAIASDEQPGPQAEHLVERRRREAVATAEAARHERPHLASERTERLGQDGGRGDAVAVVVAEYDDELLLAHGSRQAAGGGIATSHRIGRRELGEPRPEKPGRPLVGAEAHRPQGLRHRERKAELACQRLGFGTDRANRRGRAGGTEAHGRGGRRHVGPLSAR